MPVFVYANDISVQKKVEKGEKIIDKAVEKVKGNIVVISYRGGFVTLKTEDNIEMEFSTTGKEYKIVLRKGEDTITMDDIHKDSDAEVSYYVNSAKKLIATEINIIDADLQESH